jgi:hypothetical protein
MFDKYTLDREKVTTGVRLPLFDLEGNMTDDYLMVRWSWTDEVRSKLDQLQREMQEAIIAERSGTEMAKAEVPATRELIRKGIAVQVASWHGPTFDNVPCTEQNVIEFLRLRPDIADRIDLVSSNTRLFFPAPVTSS